MIADGLMTPHGMKKIEFAKTNGSWTKLNSSDRLQMPKWINAAKTDATRQKRIKETVRLAKIGIRANHYVDLKKLKEPA